MIQKKSFIFLTIFSSLFLIFYLFNLTKIPIFADEAIYIHWAQLILTDFNRYLFFPLNDGKTPLFIWLLTIPLKIINDPLIAARSLSIIIGLIQALLLSYTYSFVFKQKNTAIVLTLATFLPFLVINHRLGLMDGLLTLLTTLLILTTMYIGKTKLVKDDKLGFGFFNSVINRAVLTFAFLFSITLFIKIPGILLLPALIVLTLLISHSFKQSTQNVIKVLAGVGLGGLIFGFLALNPAFPQLFSRSSDFLHDFNVLFTAQIFEIFRVNLGNVIYIFESYLTLPLLLTLFLGPLITRNRISFALLLGGITFLLPLVVLAEVVHSRYFLPAVPFFILSISHSLYFLYEKLKLIKFSTIKILPRLVITLLLSPAIISSLILIVNPERFAWTSDDRSQFYDDWSSGHGIKESADLITSQSQEGSIAVATEGYFGSLPDGLMVYLYNRELKNVYVEGIGQPVDSIQGKYLEKANQYDRQWLVANNFRMNLNLDREKLIAEYCRPFEDNNCLQVWDISSIVEQ